MSTTIITNDDLRIHGSTGSLLPGGDEQDSKKFLGGRCSAFSEITLNNDPGFLQLENVFPNVPGAESLAGSTTYRCIYIVNNHFTANLSHIYVWITKLTDSPDDEIYIGRSGVFNQLLDFDTSGRFMDMGGPLISGSKTWLAYVGPDWSGSSATFRQQIDTRIQALHTAGYFNKLSQYRGMIPPTWGGSFIVPITPKSGFSYDEIYGWFLDIVKNNRCPGGNPTLDSKLAIHLIPQPKSKAASELTAQTAGYHDYGIINNKPVAYGFSFPFTLDRNKQGLTVTSVLAHEIVELTTDPFPVSGNTVAEVQNYDGIVDPSTLGAAFGQYELADICSNSGVDGKVNGTDVEGYWSNLDNGCVLPQGSTGDIGLVTEQVIPNEHTAPAGVDFVQAFDSNPLHLSALSARHAVGLWLKRVVNANAETTLNNKFTLHIQGLT